MTKSKDLVILDLDNVIIKGQSQELLIFFLLKKKMISFVSFFKIFIWFLSYKLGIVDNPKKIMEQTLELFKDKKIEEVERIAGDFFDEVLKKFIFCEIIDIIRKHGEEEREILVVSNAVDIIVQHVVKFLNIENFIGTRLEIIDNRLTGKILGDIIYGDNKRNAVDRFLKEKTFFLRDSWVYADHISDLSILMMARNAYAVNPSKKLFIEAKKRNWPILSFYKTLNY